MSAILSADDLNDFISPGVACIKPVESLAPAASSAPAPDAAAGVILDGQQPGPDAAPASVSLTDCLACSGCVTSAEAVLVSLQSQEEVLSVLDAAPALRIVGPDPAGAWAVEGLEDPEAKLFVASVSPQARANLAVSSGQGISEAAAGRMLNHLLTAPTGLAQRGKWQNAFSWVVDTNTARQATLVLGADEVFSPRASSPSSSTQPSPPVLAAACPGWVCYAEKAHPYALPHLSRVKSPQAMMGTLLKTVLSQKLAIPPSRIWHLAIMPCFDKKLEASREELTDLAWAESGLPDGAVRDVDCVITSKEVIMLAQSSGIDFLHLPTPSATRPKPFPEQKLQEFLFPPQNLGNQPRMAGTSGGLLYHILQRKARQTPGAEIQESRGRNADVAEYAIVKNGEPVFKAARYYGFRNIQNLVRRLRPARPSQMPGGKPVGSARRPGGRSTAASLDYSYVEVMACPGGCTNGGGQIKADDPVVAERRNSSGKASPEEQKEWLARVNSAYFSGAGTGKVGDDDGDDGHSDGDISESYIRDILAYWSEITGIGLEKLAYTSHREVVSGVGKDAVTYGNSVAQLAGKIGGGW